MTPSNPIPGETMSNEKQRFEVGNTVYAMSRVTTVEKIYKNGNFKLAGIEGQWRQDGWKAGVHGHHRSKCVHYTEDVQRRVARELATFNLRNTARDLGFRVWRPKTLSTCEIEKLTDALSAVLKALEADQ